MEIQKLIILIVFLLAGYNSSFGQNYTFDHFLEYSSCRKGDGGKPVFYRIVSTEKNASYNMDLYFTDERKSATIADYDTELFHTFSVKQTGSDYTFNYEGSRKMMVINKFLYDKIEFEPGKNPDSYELKLYSGKNDRKYRRKLLVDIEKSDFMLNNQLLIDAHKGQIENISAALTKHLNDDRFLIRKSRIQFPGGENCMQIVKNHPLELTVVLPEKLQIKER